MSDDEETPSPIQKRSPRDWNDNQARREEIIKRIKEDPTQFVDILLDLERQIDDLWNTISIIVPVEEPGEE